MRGDEVVVLAVRQTADDGELVLDDLGRGFATVTKMLSERRERLPVATVSFLNARANRLVGPQPSSGIQPLLASWA